MSYHYRNDNSPEGVMAKRLVTEKQMAKEMDLVMVIMMGMGMERMMATGTVMG